MLDASTIRVTSGRVEGVTTLQSQTWLNPRWGPRIFWPVLLVADEAPKHALEPDRR